MIDAEDINSYFASISGLASKVVIDCEIVKQSCMRNGRWEGLSVEQQEELLDRFMIDQVDREVDESPNCFPVYKINCGEKLVVDFEHDDGCTTWIDEHSAPFSWKTKSQQDLTLADFDDTSQAKDECKKNRFAKRPRSPDRSVWESATVFDDKDKNEIEKMFEKFGIKAYDGDDNALQNADETEQNQSTFLSPSHVYNEQSKLLDVLADVKYENQSFVYESDTSVVKESEPTSVSVWNPGMSVISSDVMATDESDIGSRETLTLSAPEKTKRKKHGKGSKEKHNHKDNLLLADVSTSPFKNQLRSSTRSANQYEIIENLATPASYYSTSLGSVSPVYLADPGESFTDDDPLPPVQRDLSAANGVVLSVSENSKDNLGVSFSELDGSPSSTLLPDDSGRGDSVIKTGFDFLDEW